MLDERRLTALDVGAVLALQTRVHRAMPHQDWLAPTPREPFEYMLTGGGWGMGVFDGERLVGAWLLYYPFDRQDNLARPLGLPLDTVAHLELALLKGQYRGRGLHLDMVRRLVHEAQMNTDFDVLAATVHPQNAASLGAFLKCGFEVFDTRPMYGGTMRSILTKNIKA